jgi:hypothetical protein
MYSKILQTILYYILNLQNCPRRDPPCRMHKSQRRGNNDTLYFPPCKLILNQVSLSSNLILCGITLLNKPFARLMKHILFLLKCCLYMNYKQRHILYLIKGYPFATLYRTT